MNKWNPVVESVVEENSNGHLVIPGLTVLAALIFSDIRLMLAAYEYDSLASLLLVWAYPLCWVTVYWLLTSKRHVLRIFAEIFLFSAIYTDTIYLLMSAFPFSFPDAVNIRNNPGYAPGAIASFGGVFLIAFIPASLGFILVKRALPQVPAINVGWVKLLPPINILVCVGAFLVPGAFDFLPSVYRVPGNLLSAGFTAPESRWQRGSVNIPHVKKGVRDVVLIVDESISGNVVSINGYHLPTTPFLDTNGDAYVNFGIAGAFTNFSAGSNFALLSGLQPKDLPDHNFKSFDRPSLFQFAKIAGYKTHQFDAQTAVGQLHNYTTSEDLHFIDEIYRPQTVHNNLPLYYRDSAIGARLPELLSDEEPSFIIINKSGAHWPYKSNYPASFHVAGLHGVDESSREYMTAIAWSVDKFFERLLPALNQYKNALVIYTADHGENYDAGLYQMRHASIYNATSQEGEVPLFLIDHAGFLPKDFHPEQDSYTHARIFPTLLEAMGYNKSAINAEYGNSLTDPVANSERWFLTGDVFGRGKNYRRSISSQSPVSSKPITASTPSLKFPEAWSK